MYVGDMRACGWLGCKEYLYESRESDVMDKRVEQKAKMKEKNKVARWPGWPEIRGPEVMSKQGPEQLTIEATLTQDMDEPPKVPYVSCFDSVNRLDKVPKVDGVGWACAAHSS